MFNSSTIVALAGNGLWLGVVPKTNINYENKIDL